MMPGVNVTFELDVLRHIISQHQFSPVVSAIFGKIRSFASGKLGKVTEKLMVILAGTRSRPGTRHLEGRQADLGCRGLVQAKSAFADFGHRLAFEMKRKAFA